MSFAQHLQLVLDPALPLPLHIDLGECSCSWKNGKFQHGLEQLQGFRRLTRDELMQLMRRLQAKPHVILLNLESQHIDGATMQEIAAAIAALSELQTLVLYGSCPAGTSPLSLLACNNSTRTTACSTTPQSPFLTRCRQRHQL
jgi:hypothetical protein